MLASLADLNIDAHQHDGITVLSPTSTDEVAAILRAANAQSLAVEPTGGRTKLTWGSRVIPRLQLSTTRLSGIREHVWQDMTATVAAGTPWSAMQRELARHNQRVALDPVFPDRATVGGIYRDQRLRCASPPLRLAPRPRSRDDDRARRRHHRAHWREGRQKRRRLRSAQAAHRVFRHPRRHHRGHLPSPSAPCKHTQPHRALALHHATRRRDAPHHCRSTQPRSHAAAQ